MRGRYFQKISVILEPRVNSKKFKKKYHRQKLYTFHHKYA